MYKKFIACLLLNCVCMLVNAQQQKLNILKANPLGYFILSGNISYERLLAGRSALQVNLVAGSAYSGEFKTTAARADYRYYLGKKSRHDGFYAALGMGYEKFSFYTSYNVNGQVYRRTFSANGFAAANYYGYQYRINNHFSLDAFAGVQKLFSKFRDKDGFEYLPNTPKAWVLYIVPVLGVSAGYSF